MVRCVTKYHDITEGEVSNVIYVILMEFKLAINLAKVNTEKCKYTGTAYLVEVFYLYNMQKQNHCRVGLLKNLIDQMIVLGLFARSKCNRKTNLTTILV